MKKLILILALVLTLTACAEPAVPTEDTTPTPPTVSTQQTPYEILSAALSKTMAAEELTVEVTKNGETRRHSGTPEEALAAAKQWIQNPNFLADFCATPLRAIPSNTGVIRYELSELTAAELSALLGAEFSTEDACSIALEVDADGALSAFSYAAGSANCSIRKVNNSN